MLFYLKTLIFYLFMSFILETTSTKTGMLTGMMYIKSEVVKRV